MKILLTVLTAVWLAMFAAFVFSVRWSAETDRVIGNIIPLESLQQGLLVATLLIPLVFVILCLCLSESRRSAKKHLTTLQQTLKRIGFDLQKLESAQAAIATAVENEDVTLLEQRLETLESAVNSANEKLTRLQSERAEGDGSFLVRIEAIRAKQTKIKEELGLFNAGSPNLNSALEELKETNEAIESQLSDIDDEELKDDLGNLEDAADNAVKRLSALEEVPARLRALQEKLLVLKQQLQPLADEDNGVNSVHNQLKELGEEIEGSLDDIGEDDLESEINDLETKQEELAERVNTVKELMVRLETIRGDFAKISLTSSGQNNQ